MAGVHASLEAHNARFGTTVSFKRGKILCRATPKRVSKHKESDWATPPSPVVAQFTLQNSFPEISFSAVCSSQQPVLIWRIAQ